MKRVVWFFSRCFIGAIKVAARIHATSIFGRHSTSVVGRWLSWEMLQNIPLKLLIKTYGLTPLKKRGKKLFFFGVEARYLVFCKINESAKNQKKYTRWKLTGSCHVCKLTPPAWRDAGPVSLRILEQSNWTLYPDLAWITNHFDSNKAAIFKPWDWEGGELRRWAHPSIECGPASFVNFAFNWEDVASGSRVANLLYVGTEGSLRRKQHLPLHRIEAVAVHWHWPARRVQLPLHPPQIGLRWGAIGKVWIHPHWGRTSSSDAILILHIRKLKEGDKYWGREG